MREAQGALIWFGASTANYGVLPGADDHRAVARGCTTDAAKMFIYVSLAGVLGRTGFAFLPIGWAASPAVN